MQTVVNPVLEVNTQDGAREQRQPDIEASAKMKSGDSSAGIGA